MSLQLRLAICESKAESTFWNPLCSIPDFAIQKDSFMAKAKPKKKSRSTGSESVRIGVIGGSGLYHMPGLENTREVKVKTPFGDPSDALVVGTLEGKRVAFLARHARGHRLLPAEINYRANIHAMKQLGVERIVSVSAVGSLQEDLKPLDFLIPDQFYDRTRHRVSTFFGDGVAAHVGFAKPVCGQLTGVLGEACDRAKVRVHRGGTYICMEGPQFSTLAEAHVHRQLRFEVIGMTNVTEAKLAREAEICYATVAMITDYDCWHPEHASVTLEEIISNLNKNAENAQGVVREAVRAMPAERACKCGSALAHAIVTDPSVIPAAARKRLSMIAGKYLTRGAR
jgi:5'-methylthioadenosine phosphorylase